MQKLKVALDKMSLIGLSLRTNNKNEMNPSTSKISTLAGEYFGQNLANNIHHRVNPGITYAVYTEFESDEHGEYTFFIGEEVSSLSDHDLTKFRALNIPASQYQKFTTDAGKMPDIIINAWQSIWKMQPSDFGGKRKYIADFERYDQRAMDPNNAVVDIFIGIE